MYEVTTTLRGRPGTTRIITGLANVKRAVANARPGETVTYRAVALRNVR